MGWCLELHKLKGVRAERSFPNEAGQPLPRARVDIDPAQAGLTRDQVMARLLDGTPSISVAPAGSTGIFLNPMTLADGEETVVLDRLRAVLSEA